MYIVMALDVSLFYFFNNLAGQSAVADSLIVFFGFYLPALLVAGLVLAVLFSRYSKWQKLELFALGFIASFIARFVVVEFIRDLYERPRPYSVLEVHQLLNNTAWSFPSGHAAFLFAIATVVCFYNKKWGSVLIAAATLITLSRVAAGIHYPSDIVGGAFVGAATAVATVFLYRALRKKSSVSTY